VKGEERGRKCEEKTGKKEEKQEKKEEIMKKMKFNVTVRYSVQINAKSKN
jgi:hypothetical protein